MKAGECIPLTEAELAAVAAFDEAIEAAECLIRDTGRQRFLLRQRFWRFFREAHPELDGYSFFVNRPLRALIVAESEDKEPGEGT